MTDTRSTQDQSGTLERARDTAADAARRTAQSIETNPLGIVVGGLAVGVLAGALLPRSQKEKELLAPVGKRLGDTARAAIDTAREQGRSELETRGFTKDAAQEQVKNLLGGLGKALSAGGAVAAKSATGKTGQDQGGQDQTSPA
ncbi:hypothetical protein [Sphingomonas sp.]|jgi:hypothetical protein|uniref:hypothetical protein n=1 Tax=Sphingomonas sp. TaxID=28214 RepID=UPI002D8077E1|nr:hypothetical protein [Sphingomonas sp.]HEU0045137.1 hypothetical protein [Sphingomonas sp.]